MTHISPAEFADRLNEIMPAVVREFARRQTNELYKGKISLQQFLVLDFLFRQELAKMNSLAHFMNVTTAAATGIIERLVRQGYVLRVYEPADRRIVKVRLTPKGNALVKKINLQRRGMLIKIFGQISEASRRDYLRILMEIREILMQDKH
jgi:DNA-binding MarR family transcriptional regulator